MITYFECGWRLNVNWKKNSINNFISHLSWIKKLSPTHTHALISICKFLKPYELLFLEFESFVKCKIWIVKRKSLKIILSVTCHGFGNLSPSYTSPHIHLWIFETLWVIIFVVWVICKWLNVNGKIIDSIILSVTCHSLRNLLPLIHIPSYTFMNFGNPMIDYWVWVICKRLNVNWKRIDSIILSVTCHCLRNFPQSYCPLISIHEFLIPYDWLFLEFESFVKVECELEKIHSIIVSVTCHGLRNISLFIHIPQHPFVNP